MTYHPDKELKLFYAIGEVATLFGITETTLRYWEREFPTFLAPRKAGRNIRQYTKEDLEKVRLLHHLLREKGMTLEGARRLLKGNPEAIVRTMEVIHRLQSLRNELQAMKDELDGATD